MTPNVPARLLGGLLCAAAFAFSAPSLAVSDEPAGLSEDANEEAEVRPPNGGDEASDDRPSTPPERSTEASETAAQPSPAAPAERSKPDRVEGVDREAAKRALLSDPKKDKPNPLLDARGPDYYDRRAKELLKNDTDKGRVELHPLMEAHPESHVVVCTAGCPSGQSAQIVSLLPKRPATPPPVATSTDPLEISCVGGCGNGVAASFAGTPRSAPAVAAIVGEWMTTVAKAPIGTEAPSPKAAASGDWMDRINRDRDAAKAAAAQKAAVTAQPAATLPPIGTKPAISAQSKTAAPTATPDANDQPKAADVAAAPPAETKPATSTESKAPVANAKNAGPESAKVAAAPAAPATPMVVAKAESKPSKPAATPAANLPANSETPVPASPAIVAEAKPVTAPAPTAPSPAAKQMAALDAPKMPEKPAAPVKPEEKRAPAIIETPVTQAPAAAIPKPADATIKQQDANKAPAATRDDVKPATATPAPSPEPKKMAALEAPKAPAAPAVGQPEAKTPAPAAVAVSKPADVKVTPPQETKVAAIEPPAVEKPAPVAPAAPKERVISVLSEDKDMNAAIGKARGSLTAFWKSYDAPAANETDHALKVAVAGNGTTEHFWLTRIKRDAGKLSGVISNQPQSVKTVKVGQRYEFTEDMISDWTFKRNGKLVGNETMRVLLPRMPEEQASVYRQMYEMP